MTYSELSYITHVGLTHRWNIKSASTARLNNQEFSHNTIVMRNAVILSILLSRVNLLEAVNLGDSPPTRNSQDSLKHSLSTTTLSLILVTVALVVLLLAFVLGRRLVRRIQHSRELSRRVKLTLRNLNSGNHPLEELPFYSVHSSQEKLPLPVVDTITSRLSEITMGDSNPEDSSSISPPPPTYVR
ncbi:hypothetical protein K493DRAFT_56081 [Basidiobolus meristosporus CBS 931.73]|uniref:Uncharacterized protein n=1 Tax=Basidiobolus meristosporus CBS 931.73 TaxID=1314790 RepID=A0A1Y1Z2Z9_9FUNG|nr:hypothetical protein K493DRAFT_56081 [Basidiobolus meristosporus CBS 931.73]|eukprot:ORY04307.1 hypothetical protein K493DRAFT_56081 [Basidiobolus meristosporus CBS 931.73]